MNNNNGSNTDEEEPISIGDLLVRNHPHEVVDQDDKERKNKTSQTLEEIKRVIENI